MAKRIASAQRRAEALRRLLHQFPSPLDEPLLNSLDEDVARDAARHGLLPAIGSTIPAGKHVPNSAAKLLQQTTALGLVQANRLKQTLHQALEALERAGIPSVPLKGRSLALRLYGNASLRRSTDVDVLIRREQLERTLEVLDAAGFAKPPEVSVNFYLREHHHLLLKGPAGTVPVEVHFRLLSGVGVEIDSDAVFDRCSLTVIDGKKVRVLTPEDEFVYLAVHAASHAFTPMNLLLDLRLLAEKRPEWSRVLALARDWHVTHPLGVALELTRFWMGLPVEAMSVLEQLRSVRLRATMPLFAPTLMLEGVHAQRDRITNWLTTPVLTEDPAIGLRDLARGIRRGAKRRLHRALGARVPADWAE